MSGWRQVTAPDMTTVDVPGACARFQWKAFGARNGWGFGSATAAWNGQAKKHPGEWPPSGVAVPIWLSWAKDPNGHAAISLADGRVLTSPVRGTTEGQEIYPSIQAMMNAFGGGMTYLGWGEQMDGTVVVERAPASNPAKPMNTKRKDDGKMQSVMVDNAHHYGVSNEFITHYATMDQSNITRAVMSATDELHRLSGAQFGNLLDGLGIPREVVQAGKVLNPQSGTFERNGTWSRNREVLAALAKLTKANAAE